MVRKMAPHHQRAEEIIAKREQAAAQSVQAKTQTPQRVERFTRPGVERFDAPARTGWNDSTSRRDPAWNVLIARRARASNASTPRCRACASRKTPAADPSPDARPKARGEGRSAQVGRRRSDGERQTADRRRRAYNRRMSTVRLFYALWPSPQLAASLAQWAQAARPACGGRVMRTETLHLTLAFLGPVEAQLADTLAAATPGYGIAPGEVPLDHLGVFQRPRILWAGPRDTPPSLQAVHDDLWQRLAGYGLAKPPQPFRPHVTLLRNIEHAEPSAPVRRRR